jgi:glycosyltransferase involved in cell wall biosynthesis
MPRIRHGKNEIVSQKAGHGSYVLLTAAFNEEAYIEETIKSVLAQVILPSIWVIVSDGSTDRTDEIVQRYEMKHSFIRLLRRNKDPNRSFASKVFALRTGLQSLTLEANQFIGHLDADISLDPSYFRDLLKKFDEDPTLGIGGGWYVEKMSGEFRLSPGSSPSSVPGAIAMFRRECYEDIGGLLPIEYGGEDWYAEIMARKCGWRVRSFSELTVRHLRETGTAGGALRYCYHQGFTDFSLGSHPMFELAKVARRIAWRPYVLGALARLLGFVMAHICGKRMVPPDFVAFLRKEQMARLWSDPSAPSRG